MRRLLRALYEVGPGIYITKMGRSEIDDLKLLPFEKAGRSRRVPGRGQGRVSNDDPGHRAQAGN